MFENMFDTPKTLIVVYKDELLMNQLKKLIETKDDKDGKVVGTKDGSVNIVSWTEKVWLDNKKTGTINDKVLYLGVLKGTASLIPTLDIKFTSFGANFGISGNQAVLWANPNALAKQDVYNLFLHKFFFLPVPAMLKSRPTKTLDSLNKPKEKVKYSNALEAAKGILGKVADTVDDKAEEFFRDRSLVERQIMFYGANLLYNGFLEEYMSL